MIIIANILAILSLTDAWNAPFNPSSRLRIDSYQTTFIYPAQVSKTRRSQLWTAIRPDPPNDEPPLPDDDVLSGDDVDIETPFFASTSLDTTNRPDPPNDEPPPPDDDILRGDDVDTEPSSEQKAMKEFAKTYVAPIFSKEFVRGVPAEILKGALVSGASVPFIVGKGVLLAGVTGLGAAYVAVTPGPTGDSARLVGKFAWSSTQALIDLSKRYDVSGKIGNFFNAVIPAVNRAIKDERVQSIADNLINARLEEEMTQRTATLDSEVTKIVKEAEDTAMSVQIMLDEQKADEINDVDDEDDEQKANEINDVDDEDDEQKADEINDVENEDGDEDDEQKVDENNDVEDEDDEQKVDENNDVEDEDDEQKADENNDVEDEDDEQKEDEISDVEDEDEDDEQIADEINDVEDEDEDEVESNLGTDDSMEEIEKSLLETRLRLEEAEKIQKLVMENKQDAESDFGVDVDKSDDMSSEPELSMEEQYIGEDAWDDSVRLAEMLDSGELLIDNEIDNQDDKPSISIEAEIANEEDLDAARELAESLMDLSEDISSEPEMTLEELGKAARAAVDQYEREQQEKEINAEEKEETSISTSGAEDSQDYENLTVVKLKDILRSRGLKVSGKKADLIIRLEENE